MTDTTDRLALALIAPGQAQKEMTHNEALARLDIMVQPVVEAVAPLTVPANPVLGECWIVGVGANGAWLGHDGALAAWTAGGWRFVAPFEGMAAWSIADAMIAIRRGTDWIIGQVNAQQIRINNLPVLTARQAAITNPAAGTIIDSESRMTIDAILAALRTHGLIAS
ncbi:MAG: DUF2793 domain-containing protein [Pseudomonadota bacterium]